MKTAAFAAVVALFALGFVNINYANGRYQVIKTNGVIMLQVDTKTGKMRPCKVSNLKTECSEWSDG